MEKKKVSSLERFAGDRLAKVNLFESPRFFCDLYCLRPGQAQRVHSHTANDKIYYTLRGVAQVTVGDETAPLEAGEVVLARAGVPHGIRNDSGEDVVCLVFMAPHPGH